MAIFDTELAQVDQARAYHIGEYLLLRVAGELPTACHQPFLQRSLLTVEPPAFGAGAYIHPNMRCALQMTPYEHQDVFRIGPKRDTVVLHHAEGEMSVEVEELTPRDDGAGLAATGVVLPDQPVERPEAVGYSAGYDFGEALRDAIGKLPPQCPDVPDWLSTYTVVSTRVEVGGIAGFNRLAVTVQG